VRQKLAQKAKQEPKFRFYSLYGGVMDPDTLWAAWNKVRSNGGAPGVDGISIKEIEQKELGALGCWRKSNSSFGAKPTGPAGQAGVYSQGPWQEEALGIRRSRSSGADGGAPDIGADF